MIDAGLIIYRLYRSHNNRSKKIIEMVGAEIDCNNVKENYNGMEFNFGPKVLLDSNFR